MIRFTYQDGRTWVGNFQSGIERFTVVQEWEKANALVIAAKGALYLIPIEQPNNYTAHKSVFVSRVMKGRDGELLFVGDDTGVYAYRPDFTIAWKRSGADLGGTHVELERCEGENLILSAQDNLDEPWHLVSLRTADGTLV